MATKEFCDSCDKEVSYSARYKLRYKVQWYHFGWNDLLLCYKCFERLEDIK